MQKKGHKFAHVSVSYKIVRKRWEANYMEENKIKKKGLPLNSSRSLFKKIWDWFPTIK